MSLTFTEICQQALYHRGINHREYRTNLRLRASEVPYGTTGIAVVLFEDGQPWEPVEDHEYIGRVYYSENLTPVRSLSLPGSTLPSSAIIHESIGSSRKEALARAYRYLSGDVRFIRQRCRFYYGIAHQ